MKYYFYVTARIVDKAGKTGYTSNQVVMNSMITEFDDVLEMQNKIKQDAENAGIFLDSIIIQNYMLLRTEKE